MGNLKITDIKTYIVPHHPADKGKFNKSKAYIFVKIETNEGIYGWGESYVLAYRDRSTVMHIEELKPHLIGADPTKIKSFQNWVYKHFAETRPSIDLYCAVSGIEIAMWDITGKKYGLPVHALLGGKIRDKIRVYANISNRFNSLEHEFEIAREMLAQGYTAIKIYPFLWGHDEDGIVEHIAKFREVIGEKTDLMIDVWRNEDPAKVLRVAKRIEKYHPCWFEEPMAPDNLDVARELNSRTSLPLVIGEAMFGKRWFNEAFKHNVAEFANPDVAVVGGIQELLDISTIADVNYIKIGPHNCNSSTVATNASVHAASVMPNFYMLETFPSYREMGARISNNMLAIENGYITVPDTPGLGIDVNEGFLASIPYKESTNMNNNTKTI